MVLPGHPLSVPLLGMNLVLHCVEATTGAAAGGESRQQTTAASAAQQMGAATVSLTETKLLLLLPGEQRDAPIVSQTLFTILG